MNKKTLHIIKQIFFYVFIVLFVGIIVLPFLWQFLTSIKPMSEISAMPAKWIPSEINILMCLRNILLENTCLTA